MPTDNQTKHATPRDALDDVNGRRGSYPERVNSQLYNFNIEDLRRPI
jgi:hypothetical protein